jgi:hypothetical protein
VLGLDPVADGPELNDRAAAVAEAFDRGLLTPGSR